MLYTNQLWALGTVQLKSENIFQKNGLGSVQVNAIAQDKFGFLWLGTMAGLYRYDGYELKQFSVIHSNEPLLSNYITNLFFDSKNNLWIVNDENGINRYNILTDKLTQFVADKKNENSLISNHAVQITEDKNHNYWIATGEGLDKLEIKNDGQSNEERHFTHFVNSSENTGSLPGSRVSSILPNGDLVWVGTEFGLCEINVTTNVITRHPEINFVDNKISNITYLAEDKTHSIWAGKFDWSANIYASDKTN